VARWHVFLAVCLASCALGGHARAQNAAPSEDLVKATFLSRFASFVTWPADSYAAPDAPINVCVVGSSAFLDLVKNATRNQSIAGHPLTARALDDAADAKRGCKIVYASGDATDETLHAVQSAPVLTVTDSASRRGGRGIIHFVVVDSRVRFHIDDALAAENALLIDSRLLSLALSVRRRLGP
jgi:hypothetical protein